ncbi:DNA polymerase, beta domain protein region [Caldicellulosiruptor saccharolyticus DSM 8903]|uniref:DNA polymerase, beta domain protein region n=1 Tax=Caldicellulosiruptor saccharolyticus (strain ATCC 43494 / DSM 8903 / Tp8T 6331) TaxID=351627 RepID=A4XG31_CALS8|nr:nucleotidyltransferase domain-containing protein [Caldicellulosiruptor saccharolyticus]ABP65866.1 DNA polymerase, beta domain protein region [Caldicellulosiruptor saccharolyticus DSM 8903]
MEKNMTIYEEVEYLKEQILKKYPVEDIIVFGSVAKRAVRKDSDIDLCLIINTSDKRELVQEMLLNLDYSRDVDIILYTPEEWERLKNDTTTFANLIYRTGVSLLGRF